MQRLRCTVWDGDNIVAVDHISHESLYAGDNNSFFVRGLDLIAKTPVFNYADERLPGDYFYIQNRHGDVVTIVDYDGNAVNTYEYDEYGNIIAETEGTNNPFKYAGEVQNMPNSLVYLRNRIYIPRLQRFLQEDPIRDGTNWYAYCNSNPLNFWDPSGLIGIKPDGSIYKDKNDTDVDYTLLKLKIEYEKTESAFYKDHIAKKAQQVRNANPGKYKVEASHSLKDYYIPDLTDDVNSILSDREFEFASNARNFIWFAKNVQTNSLVDVKNSSPEKFGRPSYSYHIIYNGEVMRGDAAGNIMYGYLGTAARFTEEELLKCAGLYQMWEDNTPVSSYWNGNYGDNPGDGEQIRYGINLFYKKTTIWPRSVLQNNTVMAE